MSQVLSSQLPTSSSHQTRDSRAREIVVLPFRSCSAAEIINSTLLSPHQTIPCVLLLASLLFDLLFTIPAPDPTASNLHRCETPFPVILLPSVCSNRCETQSLVERLLLASRVLRPTAVLERGKETSDTALEHPSCAIEVSTAFAGSERKRKPILHAGSFVGLVGVA